MFQQFVHAIDVSPSGSIAISLQHPFLRQGSRPSPDPLLLVHVPGAISKAICTTRASATGRSHQQDGAERALFLVGGVSVGTGVGNFAHFVYTRIWTALKKPYSKNIDKPKLLRLEMCF